MQEFSYTRGSFKAPSLITPKVALVVHQARGMNSYSKEQTLMTLHPIESDADGGLVLGRAKQLIDGSLLKELARKFDSKGMVKKEKSLDVEAGLVDRTMVYRSERVVAWVVPKATRKSCFTGLSEDVSKQWVDFPFPDMLFVVHTKANGEFSKLYVYALDSAKKCLTAPESAIPKVMPLPNVYTRGDVCVGNLTFDGKAHTKAGRTEVEEKFFYSHFTHAVNASKSYDMVRATLTSGKTVKKFNVALTEQQGTIKSQVTVVGLLQYIEEGKI
jgi:PRTRC genetic system protein B